ncbi:hypothetical protein AgCh_036666 [Apium graveolens]
MYFAAFDLYLVPEKTVTGLLFVICIWVDVHALIQIIRPVKQVKYLPHLIFMTCQHWENYLANVILWQWKLEDAPVSIRTRHVAVACRRERYSLKNSLLEMVKERDVREKLEGLQGWASIGPRNKKSKPIRFLVPQELRQA